MPRPAVDISPIAEEPMAADLQSILKQDVQSLFKQMVHKEGAEPEMHALLRLMARKQASDLYLTADAAPHLKVDGDTQPLDRAPLKGSDVRNLVYSIMSKTQIGDFEAKKEANLAYSIEGAGRF